MSFLKKNLLKFENFVEYLMAQNIYCSFCGSFLDGMQSGYCVISAWEKWIGSSVKRVKSVASL